MNARTALLGLFIVLTIVFASTTFYESGTRNTITSTRTSTLTQTSTTTSTSTATTIVTSLSTQTATETLLSQCLGQGSNSSVVSGGSFGTLEVGTNSPAIVCLQLYEFDTNSSFVINATKLINIEGVSSQTGQTFHGFSNFTITATSGSIDLGGPTNASEGIVVALAITAKPGASGTYFGFVTQGQNPPGTAVPTNQGYQQALYLSDQGGEQGGPDGLLVAGTSQPDYVSSAGIFLEGYVGCTSGFHVQGISYNICPDMLYYRIIGATNSTQ